MSGSGRGRSKAHHSELSGVVKLLEADGSTWTSYHMVLRKNALSYYAAQGDADPVGVLPLLDCETENVPPGRDHWRSIRITNKKSGSLPVNLRPEAAEFDRWVEGLSCACVPYSWPGGTDASGRPAPLLMSRLAMHPELENPLMVRYPDINTVPAPKRKAQILRMLRACSVVFDGPDQMSHAPLREVKREALEKLLHHQMRDPKLFASWRVFEDSVHMVRLNLLRALPAPPPVAADPDDEEDPFMDPQWPHLAAVYELLLHLVSSDASTLHQKKKLIDSSFVRQLLLLFDSEDFRERDYLKNITHRIYSKLTQRRALIRRVICNIFFEFVFETDKHNGIGEMLEILASIINGFCVPIKEEHKVMLVRALVPLHKSPQVVMFHPQLSYCMVLFVSKDHTLSREVIRGLLRYWPVGNSNKQSMFLNELEDLFEYVQPDDLECFKDQLALRLTKDLGGLHFQVAERTLGLWSSDRFVELVLGDPAGRQAFLPAIFPALFANQEYHWHESVRTVSSHILQQYREVDPDLFMRCAAEYDHNAARADADAKTAARKDAHAKIAAMAAANSAAATPGDLDGDAAAPPAAVAPVSAAVSDPSVAAGSTPVPSMLPPAATVVPDAPDAVTEVVESNTAAGVAGDGSEANGSGSGSGGGSGGNDDDDGDNPSGEGDRAE